MRNRYLVGGVLVLVLAIIALLFAVKAHAPAEPAAPQETAQSATTTEASGSETAPAASQSGLAVAADSSEKQIAVPTSPATATLIVDGTSFPLHAPEGASLKEAMDQLEQEGGFSYAYRTYAGLGSFVTEIQGRSSTDQYWILFVNGKKSGAGISSTHIRSGDVIEWKLEKSY
jgi:hypothetical protein